MSDTAAETPAGPPASTRPSILPVSITADFDTKQVIIDGVSKVLKIFQDSAFLPGGVEYDEMIDDPIILAEFIKAYRQNSSMAAEIVKDASGNPIAVDDVTTPTACGTTMAEVERLLVMTCAKRLYLRLDAEDEGEEEVKKFLFFFKRKPKKDKNVVSKGMRRFMSVKHLLGYDWQLPLLGTYAEGLTSAHIFSLGEDLLYLRSEDALAVATSFEPETIRKAKAIMGDEFIDVLSEKPAALAGIVMWGADKYHTFKKLVGPQVWLFFTRDQHAFNAIASLDAPRLRALGPLLATVDPENLKELNRLDAGKYQAVVAAMKEVFGEPLLNVMSHEALASKVLRRLIDGFLHMQVDDDTFRDTAMVSIQAVHGEVMEQFSEMAVTVPGKMIS